MPNTFSNEINGLQINLVGKDLTAIPAARGEMGWERRLSEIGIERGELWIITWNESLI
jgi:hypothetical protein